MTVLYKVGNNPLWQFFNTNGQPAVGYVWATWRDVARDEPKAVYQDNNGNFPYPLQMPLDSAGYVSTGVPKAIFFADDEPYYITVKAPGSTEPLYAFENYTPSGSGGGGTEELPFKNLFVNGQFTFVSNQSPQIVVTTPFITDLGPGWLFTKGGNDTATDTISFIPFALGQTNVPEGNPVQYFQYNCTGAGSGEIVKKLYQTFGRVSTFENQMIAFQLQGMSTVNTVISLTLTQFFGTGGSPSAAVTTTFVGSPFSLTSTWAKFLASMTVPSTGGKTLGTNGDDYVAIEINIPLNQAAQVNLTNVQVVLGELEPTYDYTSYQVENAKSYTAQYPQPQQENVLNLSQGFTDIFRPAIYTGLNTFAYADPVPPGSYIEVAWDVTVITEASPLFPYGFLISDGRGMDSYVNNFQYRRLAAYIGNLYGFGSDGIRTTSNPGSGTIQFTNQTAGAITAWADVNTGMAITAIATSPNRITQIVAPAAGLLTGGAYFSFYGATSQWYGYFIKDGIGLDPLIPGKIAVPIPITSSMTAIQVGNMISQQIQLVRYNLPNGNNGLFHRGIIPGTAPAYDPNYPSRLPAFAGGAGGAVMGSIQPFQNASHAHPIIGNITGTRTPVAGSGTPVSLTAGSSANGQISDIAGLNLASIASGGLQANPNNVQTTFLVKY